MFFFLHRPSFSSSESVQVLTKCLQMRILKFETNATEFNLINSLLHSLKTVELTEKKIKKQVLGSTKNVNKKI